LTYIVIIKAVAIRTKVNRQLVNALRGMVGRGAPATGKAALSASWPRIAGLGATTPAWPLGVSGRLSFLLPLTTILSLVIMANYTATT
jgi:hypothetical protein